MLVARFDTDQPATCGARAARRATARVSAAVRAAAPESRSRRAHKAAAGTLAIGRAQFRPSNRFQVITFFQPRFRRFFAISKILSASNTKPNLGNPKNRPGLNPIASPWLQRFDLNHLRKNRLIGVDTLIQWPGKNRCGESREVKIFRIWTGVVC